MRFVSYVLLFAGAVFGHGSWADLWLYVVGPLAGAAAAAGIHSLQTRAEPVTPESSEGRQGADSAGG